MHPFFLKKKKELHYSLPHIGHFPNVTKNNLRHIFERFCKDIDVKNAYFPLKRGNFISCKDTLF